ncbi:3-ketodihydrosphingosine reductase-like [Lineus longissimus]|uniref:3-ketodihydrosphingosine reductase-like n=1 Tax=Lineus longissimus TaxID=88925 RepID=UPI002B4C9D59
MLLETFAVISVVIAVLYVLSFFLSPKKIQLTGGHVLITGGSSGIGKAVAIEAAKQGANITLLARNPTKLAEAKAEVERHLLDITKQTVLCIPVDVSKDYPAVDNAVQEAQDKLGPIDMLVNSAGISISAKFEDIPIEDFKRLMDVNYLGSVYATRAVVKSMKKQNRGRIVFVSSQAGQVGLFGFTAYSASKFALLGLAESLQMEVKAYNIYVTLSFPPDTDTPGLAMENKSKPRETRLISETAGLVQPEVVAKAMVEDSKSGKFFSYVGLDGYLVAMLTAGMSPVHSIMEGLQQVMLMSIFRLVSFFYLDSFDRIVKKCKIEDEKNK